MTKCVIKYYVRELNMQITWTCFMLLGDDIHKIFALISGKIVTFLVKSLQIISAYLLPHPLPHTPPPTPAKQPPLPFSENGNHYFF